MQRVFPSRSQVWYYPLDFHKPTSGAPWVITVVLPKSWEGAPVFQVPGTPSVLFFRQLETPKTSNYCLKNKALGFPGPNLFFLGWEKSRKKQWSLEDLCFFWIPAKCENPWLQIHLWGGIPLSGTGSVRKSSAIASLKRESFEYVWGKN